jgi:NADH-quinone oxidoreductase subunit L
LALLSRFIDEYIVDGLVRLTAWIPRFVGRDMLGPFQNGLIQFYAATTALGVTFLLIVLLFWRG